MQDFHENIILKQGLYQDYGNVLDLWIVFLEGSKSIHYEVSYPQIQDITH